MSGSFLTAITASILATIVTTLGIYVVRHFEEWSNRNSTYFCSFAAGALISVSFLHIVPKSFELNKSAPLLLLTGYLFMHLFTRLISGYLCDRYPDNVYSFGIIPMIGIGFHSFADGLIYSVTFTISAFTGVLAAIGLVLHEFPEGIVTYVFLRKGGFSQNKAVLYAFLAAGLTTPLGVVVSYPFISSISSELLGGLLAVSAGALIYVGATHLLPQTEREPRRYSIVALLLGVAVASIIVLTHA